MIFEAAAHHVDTIGKQGRGERIASKARKGAAIKAEAERTVSINPTAAGTPGATHAACSGLCAVIA